MWSPPRTSNRRASLPGALAIGRACGTAGLVSAALAVAAAALVSVASAQAPESVIVDVGECVGIESPDRRFECYERAAEAAKHAGAAPRTELPVADEQPPQTAQSSVEDRPETSSRASNETPRAPSTDPETELEPQDEIQSVITELRETVPSTYLISLENGQVWRQTHARAYRMTPGMAVRIYPTRGSSYRLSAADLNGFIQVERVR